MTEIKLEDFPKDGDLDWRELAQEIGIKNALTLLQWAGGRKIWVIAPSRVDLNKRKREQASKINP